MTRGNQRELARQKNAKKQTDMSKGKRNEDGLSAAAPQAEPFCLVMAIYWSTDSSLKDAEIMQQKQKKANEKAETKPK